MSNSKIYAYLRVSTDAQDAQNQMHGIAAHCKAQNLKITQTVEDQASGSKNWRERGLFKVLETMQKGDTLLVSEISRLARSTLQVLEIFQFVAERELVVYVVKNSMMMDGSIQSKITTTILGLAAEIEREFIRARTREALQARVDKGLPMGRPKGQAKTTKLDTREDDIKKWLQMGLNKTSMAKLLECERNTLNAWLKRKGFAVKSEQEDDAK
jgi:DNA invertase Pin-like site-specific DNA recombinase